MPLPGGKSFDEFVREIKRKQGVTDDAARRIAGSQEQRIKRSKLELKILKMKTAIELRETRRVSPVGFGKPPETENQATVNTLKRGIAREKNLKTGEKIRPPKPTQKQRTQIIKAKQRLNKLAAAHNPGEQPFKVKQVPTIPRGQLIQMQRQPKKLPEPRKQVTATASLKKN